MQYFFCDACECLDPDAGNSRKHTIHESTYNYRRKKNPRKSSIPKHKGHKDKNFGLRRYEFGRELDSTKILKHPVQERTMSRARPQYPNPFEWDKDMVPSPQLRRKYINRSASKRNITKNKANIGSTNNNQLITNCEGKGTTYLSR